MPELPDITVYIEALEKRVLDKRLEKLSVGSPFLLRTAEPPITALEGKTVRELRRLGKRICFGFEGEFWLVLHLMIAGRLHWKHDSSPPKSARPPKNQLAAFVFESGTLTLTEAGTQRRASIHIIRGDANLDAFDRGGVEVLETDHETFARILQSEIHTL